MRGREREIENTKTASSYSSQQRGAESEMIREKSQYPHNKTLLFAYADVGSSFQSKYTHAGNVTYNSLEICY
jgi:hypothetical protein